MRRILLRTFLLFAVFGFALGANAQDPPAETPDDTAAITAAIQSYVAAFNAKDVAKLANHWSPEGVYTSRISGEQVVGHDALIKEFTATFEGESVPKLAVATESIAFVSPNVAVERGIATVTHADDDVSETSYSVVYVKRDGAWLIDRVSEEEIAVEVSNFDKLQGLDWLIGEWTDTEDDINLDMKFSWTSNKNFIARKYSVANEESIESSGMQIIGWDSVNQQICSWLFDSDGGFVKGVWTENDNQWSVQSVATLPNGTQGSYTIIIRPMDDGNYAWKKINQIVDGELLPNIEEIVIERK